MRVPQAPTGRLLSRPPPCLQQNELRQPGSGEGEVGQTARGLPEHLELYLPEVGSAGDIWFVVDGCVSSGTWVLGSLLGGVHFLRPPHQVFTSGWYWMIPN